MSSSLEDGDQNVVIVRLELGHTAKLKQPNPTDPNTHEWTVFIRGVDGVKIQCFIEKVIFHLHESFTKPKRVVRDPPYQVSESGYGSFNMQIEIFFRTREVKRVSYEYDLFLRVNESILHVRPEKLTFKNIPEDFRSKLLKAISEADKKDGSSGKPSQQKELFSPNHKAKSSPDPSSKSSKSSSSSKQPVGRPPGSSRPKPSAIIPSKDIASKEPETPTKRARSDSLSSFEEAPTPSKKKIKSDAASLPPLSAPKREEKPKKKRKEELTIPPSSSSKTQGFKKSPSISSVASSTKSSGSRQVRRETPVSHRPLGALMREMEKDTLVSPMSSDGHSSRSSSRASSSSRSRSSSAASSSNESDASEVSSSSAASSASSSSSHSSPETKKVRPPSPEPIRVPSKKEERHHSIKKDVSKPQPKEHTPIKEVDKPHKPSPAEKKSKHISKEEKVKSSSKEDLKPKSSCKEDSKPSKEHHDKTASKSTHSSKEDLLKSKSSKEGKVKPPKEKTSKPMESVSKESSKSKDDGLKFSKSEKKSPAKIEPLTKEKAKPLSKPKDETPDKKLHKSDKKLNSSKDASKSKSSHSEKKKSENNLDQVKVETPEKKHKEEKKPKQEVSTPSKNKEEHKAKVKSHKVKEDHKSKGKEDKVKNAEAKPKEENVSEAKPKEEVKTKSSDVKLEAKQKLQQKQPKEELRTKAAQKEYKQKEDPKPTKTPSLHKSKEESKIKTPNESKSKEETKQRISELKTKDTAKIKSSHDSRPKQVTMNDSKTKDVMKLPSESKLKEEGKSRLPELESDSKPRSESKPKIPKSESKSDLARPKVHQESSKSYNQALKEDAKIKLEEPSRIPEDVKCKQDGKYLETKKSKDKIKLEKHLKKAEEKRKHKEAKAKLKWEEKKDMELMKSPTKPPSISKRDTPRSTPSSEKICSETSNHSFTLDTIHSPDPIDFGGKSDRLSSVEKEPFIPHHPQIIPTEPLTKRHSEQELTPKSRHKKPRSSKKNTPDHPKPIEPPPSKLSLLSPKQEPTSWFNGNGDIASPDPPASPLEPVTFVPKRSPPELSEGEEDTGLNKKSKMEAPPPCLTCSPLLPPDQGLVSPLSPCTAPPTRAELKALEAKISLLTSTEHDRKILYRLTDYITSRTMYQLSGLELSFNLEYLDREGFQFLSGLWDNNNTQL